MHKSLCRCGMSPVSQIHFRQIEERCISDSVDTIKVICRKTKVYRNLFCSFLCSAAQVQLKLLLLFLFGRTCYHGCFKLLTMLSITICQFCIIINSGKSNCNIHFQLRCLNKSYFSQRISTDSILCFYTLNLAIQTVHDGRQFMKYIDPKLGVALPERDYGGNCLMYDPGNTTDPFHNIWVRLFIYFISCHTCTCFFFHY